MLHANAALTPRARWRLARLILDEHWPVSIAAARFQVSRRTAKRWADRYAAEGPARMFDRSSWPHHSPNKTPEPVKRKIVGLRLKQRLGPVEIAARVGVAVSTAPGPPPLPDQPPRHAGPGLGRTGTPLRTPSTWDMLHIDVKKLGNIPDGGGWRFVGRAQGKRHPTGTADKPRNRHHNPKMGTAFVHTVIDDHSRVAYAEIHDDETAATATAVLRRAVAWFAARGVSTHRVPTDNGSAYRSHLWRDTCTELDISPRRTRPYRPQTNGKHRTLPPDPGRPLGVPALLRQRVTAPESPPGVPARVRPPQTPHRTRRSTTHRPFDQPVRAAHLDHGRKALTAAVLIDDRGIAASRAARGCI